MSGITTEDLLAQGFEVDDEGRVHRVERPESPPAARREVVAAFDPSLRATGAAALSLATGEWWVEDFVLKRELPPGDPAPLGEEWRLMDVRLARLMEEARTFVATALRASCAPQATVIVEGAYHGGGTKASPKSIIKYGMAVASVRAGAASVAGVKNVYLAPPDWTKNVLVRRKGKASKPERWRGAKRALEQGGYSWPGPPPEEIKERSAAEHRADAATLVAAWLATQT